MKKTVAAALVFIALSTGCARTTETIPVLMIPRHPALEACFRGFESKFEGKLHLLDVNRHGLYAKLQSIDPKFVVAIGPDAVVALRESEYSMLYIYAEKHLAPAKTNITGVDVNVSPSVQLGAITESAPSVKRIGVVYSKQTEDFHGELVREAKTFGVKIISKKAENAGQAIRRIKEFGGKGGDKIDAFLAHVDVEIYTDETIRELHARAAALGIPVYGPSTSAFKYPAAVMAIPPKFGTAGRQGAEMGNQLLRGKKIDEIPRVFIEESEPVINR